MKKNLLITIITVLFAAPAFSAFPGADMNNTHIEGNITSSNMRPMHGENKYKDPNDQGVEKDSQSQPILDSKASETRPSERAHPTSGAKDKSEQGRDDRDPPKHHKKPKHNQQQLTAHNNQKDVDDENDNLSNIAKPETNNVNNNLRILDGESSRLNREMMLNGPQGGFQNNQPRGIGGR
ncbi:MAG: hypothetical protein ACI8TE_000125 [Francisella sp.]|jgi:hypothetical protein